MHSPSADDVARAIIAACRETGGDPLLCAGAKRGARGQIEGIARARHYALHALSAVFPDVPKVDLARMVGCMGKPQYFWKNSMLNVFRPRAGRPHGAVWFAPAALARVVAAVRTQLALAERMVEVSAYVAVAPPPDAVSIPRGRPAPLRPTVADALSEAVASGSVFDRGRFGREKLPRPAPVLSSKAALREELRRAAENTARMPKPALEPGGEAG